MVKKKNDTKKYPPIPEGKKLIFRPYRKDPKSGRLIHAKEHGLKAWPMYVDIDDSKNEMV